jgi:hypothetical protein
MTASANASGGFLGKVVPDAALDGPVRIGAGELAGIGTGVRMGGAVGVALQGDGRDGDRRPSGEPLLQLVVCRLAVGQAQPPAVVVDHDRDVVGVVEGRRAAIEGGVVKGPLGRRGPPDQFGEVAPVVVIPCPAAFGGKIVLVPPLQLSGWWQRTRAGFLAPDQVPAHRDQPRAAFRPQRRDDAGRPRSPVEAGKDRPLDPEGIQQRDDVNGERGLLPVAEGLIGQESGCPKAAKVGDGHPVPGRRQHRGDLEVAVDVIRPAVQQHDRTTVAGTGLGVANLQQTGVDLPQGANCGVLVRGFDHLVLHGEGAAASAVTGTRPGPRSRRAPALPRQRSGRPCRPR